MKLYVDERHEIKALEGDTNTAGLTEYDVDRNAVFPGFSDFKIRCYCYQPLNVGVLTYPRILDTALASADQISSKIVQQKEQQLTDADLAIIEAQQKITAMELQKQEAKHA